MSQVVGSAAGWRRPPEQRDLWWPVATVLTRIAVIGMGLLLITGPLLLWLKFNGGQAIRN